MAVAPPATRATPALPFSSPDQVDPLLEELLSAASAQLSRWLGSASQRSPLPPLALLPEASPQAQGLDHSRLLADLQLVMDGAYNPNHPGALAHLDPPPLAASIAAELVCAGLNNNLLAEELSPSLTRLERSLCTWLAEAIGLPSGAGGVPASGGSLSNLMALVTARVSRGLQGAADAVVLASADAHVSLGKALMVMGLPPEALVPIAVDDDGRLSVDDLAVQLEAAGRAGRPVLAVVATAGTTVRGAVDPVPAMAELCSRHGAWLHVDGAIGAVYALDANHGDRVAGLGLADSVTVNPQKLLGITKTSSLLLLAEPRLLQAVFSTGLPYMESSWGGGHGGECGLQGTRPAEVLKLWLGLRQLGLEGIGAILDGAISRRRQLQSLLAAVPGLTLRSGPLHLLAMTPQGLSAQQAERWSLQARQQLLEAQLMLSRPLYQGRHHLKAVLGNPHTSEAQLQELAAIIQTSLGSRP
ncbi:MAG: aminotransferase class V-fold PLP-dependent enzyme [Cyanobacteriota bacterium]|nr:aminotransferase class V-fold PLP-dependent enzyme [Cyanobacteriota bacterium]